MHDPRSSPDCRRTIRIGCKARARVPRIERFQYLARENGVMVTSVPRKTRERHVFERIRLARRLSGPYSGLVERPSRVAFSRRRQHSVLSKTNTFRLAEVVCRYGGDRGLGIPVTRAGLISSSQGGLDTNWQHPFVLGSAACSWPRKHLSDAAHAKKTFFGNEKPFCELSPR